MHNSCTSQFRLPRRMMRWASDPCGQRVVTPAYLTRSKGTGTNQPRINDANARIRRAPTTASTALKRAGGSIILSTFGRLDHTESGAKTALGSLENPLSLGSVTSRKLHAKSREFHKGDKEIHGFGSSSEHARNNARPTDSSCAEMGKLNVSKDILERIENSVLRFKRYFKVLFQTSVQLSEEIL
ncbi:hypothetical protein CLV88_11119 [Shimia abyssi]|uniref:Uncharacterized protein n=1 Tax=Shimia abyssi TaxID=1662395 RepID=A0A2P8F9A0_9RHOB|nr:hypothetical protein CLV88_11119 [Shimia abyssi]